MATSSKEERLTYIGVFFTFEFDGIGKTYSISYQIWNDEILNDNKADVLGAYKPYGVMPPQFIDGEYIIAICPELILKPVECEDDDTFHKWLEYWMLHLQLFVIFEGKALEISEEVSKTEMEYRIEDRIHESFDGIITLANMLKERVSCD